MFPEMPQVDSGLVALLLAGVGFIAGYAELKFKSGNNSDRIDELKKQKLIDDVKTENRFEMVEKKHYELDNRVMDKLSNIEKIVANIQGKLDK